MHFPMTISTIWHFLLYSPGQISQGSKRPYIIKFTDEALIEDSEEYHALRNSMKKVLGIIIALLKDHTCVEKSPATKRARVEGYHVKE